MNRLSKKEFQNNKKNLKDKIKRYENIRDMKSIEEIKDVLPEERHQDILAALISVLEITTSHGFTLATAINRADGKPFTLLYDINTGEYHDLEAMLLIALKVSNSINGEEDLTLKKGEK